MGLHFSGIDQFVVEVGYVAEAGYVVEAGDVVEVVWWRHCWQPISCFVYTRYLLTSGMRAGSPQPRAAGIPAQDDSAFHQSRAKAQIS